MRKKGKKQTMNRQRNVDEKRKEQMMNRQSNVDKKEGK